MEKKHVLICRLKKVFTLFLGFLFSISMLNECANRKPQLFVSQYRFNYENETYRIRSISSEDKTESYNELVGKKFLAADFDQDRIIDCILLGEATLNETQKIYEYGLHEVTRENKLKVRMPSVNRYVYESNDLQIEIRSFRPQYSQSFNQFRIADKRRTVYPEIIIIVDQNADGTLDKVLKGSVTLEKAQSQYAEAIAAGLQKRELIKIDNTILVKEK